MTFWLVEFSTTDLGGRSRLRERRAVGEAGADDRDRDRRSKASLSVPTMRPVADRAVIALVEDDDGAAAPAAWAFAALRAKLHVPRWISAMSPSGSPRSRRAARVGTSGRQAS